VVNGKTTYDFSIFRNRAKHIIGMYDEINSFVSYVKDAAENGLVQGDGLCAGGGAWKRQDLFRGFLSAINTGIFCPRDHRKYSFRFTGLDKLGHYGRITDHRVPDV
jgi:serine protein kinase